MSCDVLDVVLIFVAVVLDVALMFVAVAAVAMGDERCGKVNEDGMGVWVAVVGVEAVVQEAKRIVLWVSLCGDKKYQSLYRLYFCFLNTKHLHGGDVLRQIVAGCHAKALFLMQHCLTSAPLGCVA